MQRLPRVLQVVMIAGLMGLLGGVVGAIPVSAQETFDFPVRKLDCTTEPAADAVRDFGLFGEVPDGCEAASGVTFTVTGEDGSELGTCTTGADGLCFVPVTIGQTVTVAEDVSTATQGFAPRENPIAVAVEPETEASATFVNLHERQMPATGVGVTATAADAWSTIVLLTAAAALFMLGVSNRKRA